MEAKREVRINNSYIQTNAFRFRNRPKTYENVTVGLWTDAQVYEYYYMHTICRRNTVNKILAAH